MNKSVFLSAGSTDWPEFCLCNLRHLRIVAFLALLNGLTAPPATATLGNSSLQGNYFFTLHKVDTSVLGFFFTNAIGTMTFDGNGRVAVQGAINRNGNIQTLSASGTYTVDSAGRVVLSVTSLVGSVSGSVSFDLTSFLATNVASTNSLNHEILLGTKLPAQPISRSALTGRYFLVQRTITVTDSRPQFQNATGVITFDGAGNYALEWTLNRDGSATAASTSGSYQVSAEGTVLLPIVGRAQPVTLGFAPGAAFGLGATVSDRIRMLFDLFVLTKGDATGFGNGALGGSYQVVIGAVNASMGFSTSAGRVLYFGDGRAFYEMAQNRMGTSGAATGNSTIAVEANGTLQFGSIPNVAGTFRGGVGVSGHSLAAAAVNDPAVYNLLIAIRTPAQPAAVSNAASFRSTTALSPGAYFSLFGINLARHAVLSSSLPLPRESGGGKVRINGIEAPLHYVSPFQINAQVPFEVSPGPAQITVVLDGAEGTTLTAVVNVTGPGIFTRSEAGTGPGIFLHSDFELVSATNPARPGEVILIYGTGLGGVVPSVESGAAAPGDPPANAVSSVSVRIGGKESEVSFAGLAPEFAGLYQVNVQIPPDITPASDIPVVVTAGGVASNTVTIPVAP